MDSERVVAVLDRLDAGLTTLAQSSLDGLTAPEKLAVLDRLETLRRRLPVTEHRVLTGLAGQCTPTDLGAATWSGVLSTRLRISTTEAGRRLADAADLGPRAAITGAPLPPRLPVTAAAQARGAISVEHLAVIRKFFTHLPESVDHDTREAAEATLGRLAAGLGPESLRAAADRLTGYLHPDGELGDADRARRRYLRMGRQQPDGMSEIRGLLDPEARATFDAVLAKMAAPGMANPDSEAPCVDGNPSQAEVHADTRSQPQRNHDALKAMARATLASGALGQHNGLPVTVIVSTTLQELESATGHAVTGGGTLLPMPDVIRLARHAFHYLTVFDRHRRVPLYLGRSKRIASAGQRIVLHAIDRGCTFPTCTVPGYHSEVHHTGKDWANGGLTDITDLTLACGPHNRLATNGHWTTRKRHDGRTEWIPPPHLDHGQARVNDYYHPENYLVEPDDDPG